MFAVSDTASQELDAYFDGKDKSSIRVYLAPGGCSGPRLALALDEPNETDTVIDAKGYTFCINSELYATAESIRIDMSHMGFSVESGVPFGGSGGCAGCSGGCGTQED